MKKENEKVMIISWRWKTFEVAKRVVNKELLDKPEFRRAVEVAAPFLDELFDEYKICEQQPDGDILPVSPPSKIVRTFIENPLNDPKSPTLSYLLKLIQYFKREDNEVFVFLHRKDGFGDKEVRWILADKFADKCFLIGAGRDNIYYRESRNQGLLGENGKFYRKTAEPGKPEIIVADDVQKIVFRRHFEKTWAHYKHEFHTKIFELKEDLLSYLYQNYPDQVTWSFSKLRAFLAQNEPLKLRIKSFIDDKCNCLDTPEVDALDQYGREAGKSYEFDDCRINLADHTRVGSEYEEVADLLIDLFHQESSIYREDTLNELMRRIEEKFLVLLKALEEEP